MHLDKIPATPPLMAPYQSRYSTKPFQFQKFQIAIILLNFWSQKISLNHNFPEFPDSPAWRFVYCVLVSLVLLVLSLLGSALFAKTALITFVLISVCYGTWIVSVIFNGRMEVLIPKVCYNGSMLEKIKRKFSGEHSGV